ncbi:Signal recognition particle 54 [Giardia muris]|uniref:signal-recognition-particle GTPase n=1 Tax=Giardia muris TaxID=5742 RepID=A0A4Z1T1L7_GIAMU|nr:Signal recognition particle 54 [Giardia muris]|eukprot:TNJ26837.1 Signal recognition particle 54 [Giardia muris]
MVLNELGLRITETLQRFAKSRGTSETVSGLVDELVAALEAVDVPVSQLDKIRRSLTQKLKTVEDEQAGRGIASQAVQRAVVEELVALVTSRSQPYSLVRNKPNTVMFVGLQGAGKTTTCAKYGLYYKTRGWRVGVVCCDTFRAGAFDQLKQNCTATRIPFYGSYTEKDPVSLAQKGVAHFKKLGFDLILIDTSGRHRQEAALFREMQEISTAIEPDEHIFVLDSSIGQAAFEQATSFKRTVDVGSIILTKLDGHKRGGGALAAVSATNAPIIFLGTGERMDDLEVFDAQRFVAKLLGYGDLQGLQEAIQTAKIDHKAQLQTVSRMLKGGFCFNDFREQLRNLEKMGPLDKIIDMIPGMSQMAHDNDLDIQSEVQSAKLYRYIMDSMTPLELMNNTTTLQSDSLAPSFESRVRRLAIGSGCTVPQVREFMEKAKEFSTTIGSMGKKMRNPAALQQMLGSMNINPQLMQQMMAGMGNIQEMMSKQGMREAMQAMGLNLPNDAQMARAMQSMGGMNPDQLRRLKHLKQRK